MKASEPWDVVEWWDHFDTHYLLISSGVILREVHDNVWIPVAEICRHSAVAAYAHWLCTSSNLIVRRLQPQLIRLEGRKRERG